MKIIQVGNGKIARIHRDNLPQHAVVTLVVRAVEKHKEKTVSDPTLADPVITDSITVAYEQTEKPHVWDLVSDDHTHYDLLREILRQDPAARVIIGKSPIVVEKRNALQEILDSYPEARVTLTENYLTSNVLKRMQELAQEYDVDGDVIVDFTKSRVQDMVYGRFHHHDTKVLGYEGTHMLTVLHSLGKKPVEVLSIELTDMTYPDGTVLPEQGSGDILFKNEDGSMTEWYVGMDGKIKHQDPALSEHPDIPIGSEERYRIAILKHKSKDLRILGHFEPVTGIDRLLGKVYVIAEDVVVLEETVDENTIKETLQQQLCFLEESCEHYYPTELLDAFEIINKAYRFKK
jgi:hypothetical protein